MNIVNVNAHLHTPFSFSAFSDITQALDKAVAENVKVVGVNDFYTPAAYPAWKEGCEARNLTPLFNIEFISLNEADQKAGRRVNDPGNPGRTYLSGKGLNFPFSLAEPFASQLAEVVKESNAQVEAMCTKLNVLLIEKNAGFQIDFGWVKSDLTKGLIRERHLAKALRIKIYEHLNNDAVAIKSMLAELAGGKEIKSELTDFAGVENELRGNFLKAGGAAFVPEDPKAFLPMQDVVNIILASGGIPTYPFLADDAKGGYTDFEGDLDKVSAELTERGFHSVEFITTRNDVALLEKYASYLHDKGFVVSFGSEHNTPAMEPVELFARNSTVLSDKLKQINYEGACVIAAHQHLSSQGLRGYVDAKGVADRSQRDAFVKLGDQIINGQL